MPAAASHMGFDYPPPEQLIYPEWNIYPSMEQYIPQQQQQQHSSHSNQHQHTHSHSQSLLHVNQIIPSRHVHPPLHSSHPRAPSSHPPTLPSHPSHSPSPPMSTLIPPPSQSSHPIDLDPPSMPSPLNYNPKAFTFQTLPTPYIDIQQQQQQHRFISIPQPMLSTSTSPSPQQQQQQPHISSQYVTSTTSPKSHEKVGEKEKVGKKRKTSVASTPIIPTQPVTPPISRPVIHVRHGDGPGFERNQRFLSEKDATSFSCHHCKVKRSRDQLLFCHATIQIETYKSELDHVIPKPRMNEKKRKPKKTNLPIYHCAKRYCHGCMKKHYGQNVNEMDVEERICYICPSCEEDCACSECSRKQQRRSISPIITHLKHLQLTYGLSHIAKTLLHTRRCDEPLPIPSSPITPNTQDDTQVVKYEITSHTSHDELHPSSSSSSHPSSHPSHGPRASSQPISSDHTKASWIQSLLTPLPNIFPSIPLPSSSYIPHYSLIDYSSTSTSTSTSTSSSTESTPPQHTHALHDHMIIHRPATHTHPPTHSRSTSHPHPSHTHSHPSTSHSHPSQLNPSTSNNPSSHHHKRRSLDHIDEETTKRIRVKRNNKK